MVGRIADILQVRGDPDSVNVRRSKAIGILAQPAEALRLLLEHQDDAPHPADAAEPDPTPEDAPEEEGGPHRSVRLSPLPIDPDRCRPRAVVYVHLSGESLAAEAGVARVEAMGPVLPSRVRRLLGDRCQVIVKPVLDLAEDMPVDAYELPVRLREILRLRQPASVFPYGVNTGRGMEADHTFPYLPMDRGGPPGQTGIGKLGFLVRFEHRVKTHGRVVGATARTGTVRVALSARVPLPGRPSRDASAEQRAAGQRRLAGRLAGRLGPRNRPTTLARCRDWSSGCPWPPCSR